MNLKKQSTLVIKVNVIGETPQATKDWTLMALGKTGCSSETAREANHRCGLVLCLGLPDPDGAMDPCGVGEGSPSG